MVACVTCFGVAANTGNVNGVADDSANAKLPYTLKQIANANISVTPVSKSSSDGSKMLKGYNLSSATLYESIVLDADNTSNWVKNGQTVTQKGMSMYYKDMYTFTVGQTLDIKQLYPLIKNREVVSIMLWTSEGSEILDYSGELDEEFEWACWLGNANKELATDEDYAGLILFEKKRLYMENPPKMTYRTLAQYFDAYISKANEKVESYGNWGEYNKVTKG